MWQILFYEDHRGKSPALEYINSLPHARRIEGKLWELRPGDNRLFYCLYNGRQFVIRHGCRKKTMQTPEKEIQTALRRMNDLLEK